MKSNVPLSTGKMLCVDGFHSSWVNQHSDDKLRNAHHRAILASEHLHTDIFLPYYHYSHSLPTLINWQDSCLRLAQRASVLVCEKTGSAEKVTIGWSATEAPHLIPSRPSSSLIGYASSLYQHTEAPLHGSRADAGPKTACLLLEHAFLNQGRC